MTNKEAIEVLKANYPDACFELLREAVDVAIEALSEQQWIPCDKDIPTDGKQYIITIEYPNGEYEVTIGEYWQRATGDEHGWGFTGDGKVTAWQPLPDPYREKGEQE